MISGKRTPGRARARLHAPDAQPVTFVELFFDLVFVFAITELTGLAAYDLTPSGIGRALVIFWLIWWAWTQFTWTLSPADTQHPVVRLLTLVATFTAFVMAASVQGAFGDDGLWFAIPYVVIRAIGMGLQVRVDLERPGREPGMSMRWVWTSMVGLVVVLAGAVADPELRPWIWLGAILVDFAAAGLAATDAEWDLKPGHFSERHGLFVIIALGESLIVAGAAVAPQPRTVDVIAPVGAALVVTCLLWWTYFGWLKDALEERFDEAEPVELGPMARDAYSFGHVPVIVGIIAFAIAVKDIAGHPETPTAGGIMAALAGGAILFVGGTALAYWRVAGVLLLGRLVAMAAIGAVVALLHAAEPEWALGAVALVLLAIVLHEERTHRPTDATVDLE